MKKELIAALTLSAIATHAHADAVTDWNARASDILIEAKLGTPAAVRGLALAQTAVHDALATGQGFSVDAAVAAANRGALAKIVPTQQAAIDAAYKAALATIAEGPAKSAGIAAGERAAEAVMARRAADKLPAPDQFQPHAVAGVYVPTAAPLAPKWSTRTPWLMSNASQFRPAPPPALTSEAWARDFNEIKAIGSKNSTQRTSEQEDIARFWEYSLPPIYFGLVHSVANAPGRDPMRNARLYAAVAQAMDDAMISVFDAKYHYNFWRPITAIRNGDIDGNDSTQREASWSPLIDSPMHPEFPSGHAILAASVGAVLKAEIGAGPAPVLVTTSPTAKGMARRWTSPDEFVREVSDSRIYAGIHFRSATDAGSAAGTRIGQLAAAAYLSRP